jgi:hypothetical protein
VESINFFEKRVQGPNEIYARWENGEGRLQSINFDRRSKNYEAGAKKYINSINFQLSKMKYSMDFLEFLPAEPFIPMVAKIVGLKKNCNFIPQRYGDIRRHLLNNRLINHKWMNFVKYDGTVFPSTPCFLNAAGKFYYQARFNASADTMAKGFYRDKIISNKDFSVNHIFHLQRFYKNNGHDVVMGQYPFDLIVDQKHGFILTEMHENSIGIEMRLSEALFQSVNKGIHLYLPAMTVEHRGRICGIMGGLLFESRLPAYSYASYLESEICSDTKINNWSYFITKTSKEEESGKIFPDPLPFPKINLNSSMNVATQLSKIGDRIGDISDKKVSRQFSLIYPLRICNQEIVPGIKVTVGFGLIKDLWQELATGSDILITSKVRMTILDNLKKLPKVMIINEFDINEPIKEDSEVTYNISNGRKTSDLKKTELEAYRALKRNNVKIIMLPLNHAKAILNEYKLMIHSMPTTHYMGNNRESFGLIDFSEHPERDKIHAIIYDMLIDFGKDYVGGFSKGIKLLDKYFNGKICLYGHFSNQKTVKWAYYRTIIYHGKKKDYTILTSHIDFIDLTRRAKKIRIQGVSRFANHISLMKAPCPVTKERMWHPRMIYNDDIIGVGSWDFAEIQDQKELQMLIHIKGFKAKSDFPF